MRGAEVRTVGGVEKAELDASVLLQAAHKPVCLRILEGEAKPRTGEADAHDGEGPAGSVHRVSDQLHDGA